MKKDPKTKYNIGIWAPSPHQPPDKEFYSDFNYAPKVLKVTNDLLVVNVLMVW